MKARSQSRSGRGTKIEENENVSVLVSFYPYVVAYCIFNFPIKYNNYFNLAEFNLSFAAASVRTTGDTPIFCCGENST